MKWFNPREGGAFQTTGITKVKGGKVFGLGYPPAYDNGDLLVLITK